MRKLYVLLIALQSVFFFSCTALKKVEKAVADVTTVDGHPAWIMQGNIYEVNVRQYTPEGTFSAFEKHLPRLKEMGVQTLWFMPIHPISQKDHKGALGSYYAVANYRAINPEYGTLNDWKRLVNRIHEMGMKVILDWVPNHTGADHYWLQSHPHFYVRDSAGNFVAPFDWTDVRKLNYNNPQLVDSMIATLKYWITETGIDGYRCDVAGEVPAAFWTRANQELKAMKNVFLLAESNDAWLHTTGFDASYPWDMFHMMKQVAGGARPAFALDSVRLHVDSTFLPNALRMYFTSNHDENSWNKADYATMPGAVHAPFAVLTQTLDRSIPLIYSGQEEPVLDSISFFYKDTIPFKDYARAPFYKTLLTLRANNSALAGNASFKKLRTNNDAALYAFEREKEGHKVLVITNLSNQDQLLKWVEGPSAAVWNNVFSGRQQNINPPNLALGPWAYLVLESKK
jgi:alpha-amylase